MEYITDKIGEEYKDWKTGDYIYINAPMGTGKTQFVFNTLAEYATKSYDEILYLCNRKALRDEVKDKPHSSYMSKDRLTDRQLQQVELEVRELWEFFKSHKLNVRPMTYQKLEFIIAQQHRAEGDWVAYEADKNGNKKLNKHGLPIEISKEKIKDFKEAGGYVTEEFDETKPTDRYKRAYNKLLEYKYIVFDEIQYFLEDSTFNPDTHLSFDFMWQQTEQCKILMSATGNFTKKFGGMLQDATGNPAINFKYSNNHYYIPKDISYIDFVFFKDDKKNGRDYPVRLIKDILSETKEDKIIYFVDRTDRMKTLLEIPEIKENAHFVLSKNNGNKSLQEINEIETYLNKINDDTITFDKQVLITTSALCNGISLKDRNIKHIICDISNIYTAIQCIGRKRPLDEEDKVTVYIPIKSYSKTQLAYYRHRIELLTKYINCTGDRRDIMASPDFELIEEAFYTDYINTENNNPVRRVNNARLMYYTSQEYIYTKWLNYTRHYNDNTAYAQTFLDIAGMQDCKVNSYVDISETPVTDKIPRDELLAFIDKYKFDNWEADNNWKMALKNNHKEIKKQLKQWDLTIAEFELILNEAGYTYKEIKNRGSYYHKLIAIS